MSLKDRYSATALFKCLETNAVNYMSMNMVGLYNAFYQNRRVITGFTGAV